MFVTIGVFLNKVFKFQSYVCNRYHELVMVSMNLGDTAILNIKGAFIDGLLAELPKVRSQI